MRHRGAAALMLACALLASTCDAQTPNPVGSSEVTPASTREVSSMSDPAPPSAAQCVARFLPTDFDRIGTLAPCYYVADLSDTLDDDANVGGGDNLQGELTSACDACVVGVGDSLVPRMLDAGMDPTVPDAVMSCLTDALPAALASGLPVFAVIERCDLLSLRTISAANAGQSSPERERPRPEPRPRDPRYPDTGLTGASADADRATVRTANAAGSAVDVRFDADPAPAAKKTRRGLSDGAIVSIVVVCIAGSVLPFFLLVACLHARRRKREEKRVLDLEGAG